MTPNEYPAFLDLLMALTFCFRNPRNLEYAGPQYFEDLQPFDLAVVQQALRRARQTCDDFPPIAVLLALAESIRRETIEVQRHQETHQKLLGYEAEARASGLSPAERQTNLAELYAVLGDHMRMPAVTTAEPRARPRELHPAYRTPTTDDAARKDDLRRQMAQVLREEDERTSATVSRAAG